MKYILCEPCSGFNDTLTQIYNAWLYAKKTERVLVINTCHGSSLYDDFDAYFTVTAKSPKVIPRLTPALQRHLNSLPTHPQCLQGRLHLYGGAWSDKLACLVDTVTGTPLRLDFRQEYPEALVVHANSGTGDPVELLAGLQLKKELAQAFSEYLSLLGNGYCAVHVRNTDYRTDYKAYFREIAPRLEGKTVLMCSDDWKCRIVAAKTFAQSRVISLTDIPKLPEGKPLHIHPDNAFKNNLDMLLDFVGLAGADELFVAPVGSIGMPGGFGRLARDLHARKDIYQHFYLDAL